MWSGTLNWMVASLTCISMASGAGGYEQKVHLCGRRCASIRFPAFRGRAIDTVLEGVCGGLDAHSYVPHRTTQNPGIQRLPSAMFSLVYRCFPRAPSLVSGRPHPELCNRLKPLRWTPTPITGSSTHWQPSVSRWPVLRPIFRPPK